MTLAPGTRLGPYEIVAALGTGGMGEVYRGRDARLRRDVAIKVLRPEVADSPDRLARFRREAQVLASLNHPNIAHVHGIEESAGTPALIMELVEGETLADRVARGALPIDEAVHVARQLADALDAAHERGIIHRDLKPSNVKVTSDGSVKVLDFGLAKAQDPSLDDCLDSPTMTSPATMSQAGVILGTAAYMAPEQARGATVDKRADIWAFGCVLFEMLTARRAFGGDSVTETLAAVMRDEVPLDRLPAATPPAVARLIVRCLQRDLKRRLRDIGEARIALDDAIAPPSAAGAPSHAESTFSGFSWSIAPWVVAGIAIAIAGYLALRPAATAARDSLELEIAPPAEARFLIDDNSGNVLLSPDGTKIVFRAVQSNRALLWVRSLARDDARPLAGTGGAQYPFWAPDSRRLGFFADGKLKTLDTAAGLAQVIADAANGRGGSWGDDDVILFVPEGGRSILRIAAGGGPTHAVTRLDTSRGENAHYWPIVLPGGKTFLYFVRSTVAANNGIYVAAIDGSGATRLVSSFSSGIYAPPLDGSTGYLLWVQNGELLAQPFDAGRSVLTGEPTAITDGVRVFAGQLGVVASTSRSGALAWASARGAVRRFAWVDRAGRRLEPLPIAEGEVAHPALSRDGNRLLYTRIVNGTADIFLYDFARQSSRRITPSPDYDEQPSWSPDGTEMAYSSIQSGADAVMRIRVDGSAPPAVLTRDSTTTNPTAWTADGRYLLMWMAVPGNGNDTFLIAADGSGKPMPLLTGPANEIGARFSPDGRWMLFNSDGAGRNEAYAVRFHGEHSPPTLGGPPILITPDGGGTLGWRRDGKEIVIRSRDQVMAVPVEARDDSLTVGQPIPLFRPALDQSALVMAPEGNRFLVIERPYDATQTIRLLTNWRARLVQAR